MPDPELQNIETGFLAQPKTLSQFSRLSIVKIYTPQSTYSNTSSCGARFCLAESLSLKLGRAASQLDKE